MLLIIQLFEEIREVGFFFLLNKRGVFKRRLESRKRKNISGRERNRKREGMNPTKKIQIKLNII